MPQGAKVRSIDAVGTFSAALKNFEEEATGALTSLDMEVRRVLEWIHQDRKEFWKHQVRRRQDKVAEARGDLQRCMTYRSTKERPSCHDEKIALEKAKRRLRVAEEKVLVVRHWARVLDHEVNEFKGNMNQLAHWLQIDHPQALATLERMMAALSAYVGLESTVQSDAGNEPFSRPAEPADATAEKTEQDGAEDDAASVTPEPEDQTRANDGDKEASE